MAQSDSIPNRKLSRRRIIQAGLVGAAGLALYSGEIERHWIEITHTEVRLPGLHPNFDGARIVQVSDIHLDEFTEPFFLHEAIRRINQLQPDIVLLTGDFVSIGPRSRRFAKGAAWQCANLLTRLQCRQLYAVLGNHDVEVGIARVTDALTTNGITVLNNSCLPIERMGQRTGGRIWLAGTDDPLMGNPDSDLAIPASIRNRPGEPVVLMCHGPDYADHLLATPVGQAVDLMLSGHTHGGQVRIPFIGPLALPLMGRKYIQGWFRFGKMQLYVNRGLGTVGVPFRLDCPPEITVFTLRQA